MSASKQKKLRQDRIAGGTPDFKTRRQEEEWKKEHRTNVLYAIVGITFVVVAVALVVWNSNFFQRRATAVSINGVKYTAADMNYYYITSYNSVVNQYSSYLSYLGLSTSTSLKKQSLNDTAKMFLGVTDDMTWDEYFKQSAKTSMIAVTMLAKEANANNYAFTDEMQSVLDSAVSSLETSASSAGYSTKDYLKAVYGSYMTMSILQKDLKQAILASYYEQSYVADLNYTDDQITSYYNDNKNSFDLVDYDYVNIKATAATKDADGNTVTPTDEQTAAAQAAAKAAADDIYARYQAGETLTAAAADYSDIATAGSRTGATYAAATTTSWAFDSSRVSGDSTLLNDDSYYYIVVFHSRYRNDYNTVNMRHILFKVDKTTLDSTSATYNDDLAALRQTALDKANDVLQQWKAQGSTEDAFAALADANSDDTASGGLYKQVYKDQMATEINDWLFDPARKSGDCDIVLTDSYGYHIVYFIGTDEPYWKVQVKSTLTSSDYSSWTSGLVENITAVEGSGMKYVGK